MVFFIENRIYPDNKVIRLFELFPDKTDRNEFIVDDRIVLEAYD